MNWNTYSRVENIDGFDGSPTILLVAKHKVYPVVKVLGDLRRLECSPMNQHEPDSSHVFTTTSMALLVTP